MVFGQVNHLMRGMNPHCIGRTKSVRGYLLIRVFAWPNEGENPYVKRELKRIVTCDVPYKTSRC